MKEEEWKEGRMAGFISLTCFVGLICTHLFNDVAPL